MREIDTTPFPLMAIETATIAFVTLAGSLITGFGTWYATRVRAKEVNSSEATNLLRMLMEERQSRESEIRLIRKDYEHLSEQYDRIVLERLAFAEEQQTVRHNLRTDLRAANVKIEVQALEIADLKNRISHLEFPTAGALETN